MAFAKVTVVASDGSRGRNSHHAQCNKGYNWKDFNIFWNKRNLCCHTMILSGKAQLIPPWHEEMKGMIKAAAISMTVWAGRVS